MDPDDDSFVASRMSLQSRRDRLAKRNEQSAQETQRTFPSDGNHAAEATSLPDATSNGDFASTGRTRRLSETRPTASASSWESGALPASRIDGSGRSCRDREYVQPKIDDHCDVVALSLIESSSILSDDQSSHVRCSRSLSGEGSMQNFRRTMPAKMRASYSGERGLLDNANIADSVASRIARRTSVDGTGGSPAANGSAGESLSQSSSLTNRSLRRHSSFNTDAAAADAAGRLGWMPGHSTLTSSPAHSTEIKESVGDNSKNPLESTISEESREERIARFKEQRRRSKLAHSFVSSTNDEREISGSTTKQWHSLEDGDQQLQQPIRRGSSVFFDPRCPASPDAGRPTSVASSCSDTSVSDLSGVGVRGRRYESGSSSADSTLATSPPFRHVELTQPSVPPDAPTRAVAAPTENIALQAAARLPSPTAASHHQNGQAAGVMEVQASDPNCGALSAANPRRNSARRRRSNLLADVEQTDATTVLHEVPAEAESADVGTAAESPLVVTRPRRRRVTADKGEGAESSSPRDICRDSGGQGLGQQWKQLTSPSGSLSSPSAEPAVSATSSRKSTGDRSGGHFAERSGSAEHAQPNGECTKNEPCQNETAANAFVTPPSEDAAHRAESSTARSASVATARRAAESELSSGQTEPHAPSVEAVSTPVLLLGNSSNDGLDATAVVKSDVRDNQVIEAEAKANPAGCSLPAATALPVTETSDVGSVKPMHNKTRSDKKNAALGLILQKFEAVNVLSPALAAVIGLQSPTSSSDSSQPKSTPPIKTGKVESTIKQMAAGQQPEPSGTPGATEKTVTHIATAQPAAAASVGSLVRKFAGAASPPTSLHLSLLSSTDGSDAATASKSSSPVRPASPATVGDAAGSRPQQQQRVDGDGSNSGSRPASPKVGGWPPVGGGIRSGHSSPGSARRSPVAATASSTAFAQANNVSDSDASSQLTDDGQHSDVASSRRTGVPVMKQHLQSPEKLHNQQPYFSAGGKKLPKIGSTPVAPCTSAEVTNEPVPDDRLASAVGHHNDVVGVQCSTRTVAKPEPAQAEACADAEGRQPLPSNGTMQQLQIESIDSNCEAGSVGLTTPNSELAVSTEAINVGASDSAANTQHRHSTSDVRPSIASQQQQQPPPQTFAKLRAVPPPPATKPSAASKSEVSQPMLDPQLANILQARLKKVENKGHAAVPAAKLGGGAVGLQAHDEQQHSKPPGRDDTVDRSAHSIKDRAQYFMLMQQKAQGAADTSPSVGARPSSQGISTKQPLISPGVRSGNASGMHSGSAAQHSDASRQEANVDVRPSEPGDPAAAAAVEEAEQQPEKSQQKSSRKERRRDRRRRGSLRGKDVDRWQTQPVTDSEVLVAAAVVVRGQPSGSAALATDCVMQTETFGQQTNAAAGFAITAGTTTVQPNNVGASDDVDEVRRLAVMTLEEKIGLFMDRSLAWSNCDADAVAVSPDRNIRPLPVGCEVITSRRYRRCAWRGRFSTQPVSPAELRRAIRTLGSSALDPPTELGAELNAKIERLCLQLERQRVDKQSAGTVVNQKQEKSAGRSAVRRSKGDGKKALSAADANVSLHLNGSNEGHVQRVHTKSETGPRAVSAGQRKNVTKSPSATSNKQLSSFTNSEHNGSLEVCREDTEGVSRGSTLRQSQHAPTMRPKTTEKSARARPVSMNLDHSVRADSTATCAAISAGTDLSRGTAGVKTATSRQRPQSAKAAGTTQGRMRSDEAHSKNTPESPGAHDARRAANKTGDEKQEKALSSEKAHRDGTERSGAVHETPTSSEQLTWADKSKSQPCISTMDDDGADCDLPSYMRATTSYARKVEHLLIESDDEDDNSNGPLAPEGDRASLDASRHDTGSRTAFQRAVSGDVTTTRASVRRAVGARVSVGPSLESPTSCQGSDVPSYMRATKAVSMRDIRSPAGKPSTTADELTSPSVGVRSKRRSVDGSRSSLPPPPRPASVTAADQSASGESDDDDENEELPSYMRATKSFARKVEHLIESCDEDDDEEASIRRDECSDAGDRASSTRRSPAPRRSRTPSTHGGSDLTPSEPYAPSLPRDSKQLDSDGGHDRKQSRKSQRSVSSRNASSTSLHIDNQAAHQERVPELSSPNGAFHGASFGHKAEAVAPIVDGSKRRPKTSETSAQSMARAEVNGHHKAEVLTAHAKSQQQGKDKHTLLGGELPSFMRATKSSSTKDRPRPTSMTLPEHTTNDVAKSAKVHPGDSIGRQHVKGQGSRESLSSIGASSSKAESGRRSPSESADHHHVAPIPLAPLTNGHSTTAATSKSRKSSSTRTAANSGVASRHSKQPIGAVGGAVG